MIDARITGANTTDIAKVTPNGELVTANITYSKPYYVAMSVDNQIYNVVPSQTNKRFVTTGIIISANRDITTDSIVNVFEALSDSSTSDGEVLTLTIKKSETVPLTDLNFVTKPTRWINATADDSTVDITIIGYYID